MRIKTTEEIFYEDIEGRNEDEWQDKYVSLDAIKYLLEEMKRECSECYTGLTKDSDFENAFSTMNEIVFKTFEKELGDD